MTPLESDIANLNAFKEALYNLPRATVTTIEAKVIRSLVDGKLAEIDKFICDEIKKIKTQ